MSVTTYTSTSLPSAHRAPDRCKVFLPLGGVLTGSHFNRSRHFFSPAWKMS